MVTLDDGMDCKRAVEAFMVLAIFYTLIKVLVTQVLTYAKHCMKIILNTETTLYLPSPSPSPPLPHNQHCSMSPTVYFLPLPSLLSLLQPGFHSHKKGSKNHH